MAARPAVAATQAQTITFSNPTGAITGTGEIPGSFVDQMSFALFNANLGTLTGVQIQYTLSFTNPTDAGIQIQNANNGKKATLTETVTGTLGAISGANATLTGSTSGTNTQQVSFQFTGGGNGTQGGNFYFTGSSAGTTSTAGLSDYTSSLAQANYTYNITGFATDFEAVGGGVNNSMTVNIAPTIKTASGTLGSSTTNFVITAATITYTYNPVPATPAQTTALLGLAMGGAQFGLVRLRRRRAATATAAKPAE